MFIDMCVWADSQTCHLVSLKIIIGAGSQQSTRHWFNIYVMLASGGNGDIKVSRILKSSDYTSPSCHASFGNLYMKKEGSFIFIETNQ